MALGVNGALLGTYVTTMRDRLYWPGTFNTPGRMRVVVGRGVVSGA
jgi:hypothetical protein